MDYLDTITKIEKRINEDKINRAKLEEKQKILQEEKDKLLKELSALGIEEPDLEEEIAKLDASISEQIKKCQALLDS